MFDCDAADRLLIEATKKLLWLRQRDGWAKELPNRCPPILWFGNARSQKPKVLTIGANPSRWEYLDNSCRRILDRFKETGDESLLHYLEPPRNRFRVLAVAGESVERILADHRLRSEIIQGYNSYFCKNPYQKWFGHPKEDSYKVEGFFARSQGILLRYGDNATSSDPYRPIALCNAFGLQQAGTNDSDPLQFLRDEADRRFLEGNDSPLSTCAVSGVR